MRIFFFIVFKGGTMIFRRMNSQKWASQLFTFESILYEIECEQEIISNI